MCVGYTSAPHASYSPGRRAYLPAPCARRFGKRFFHNAPFAVDDWFHVAQVTPVVHYTMGGLAVDDSARILADGAPIPGL